MSSLQCPATLLLVAAGPVARAATLVERVAGRRVAHVWSTAEAARPTAYALAEGLGVGVSEPTTTGVACAPDVVVRTPEVLAEVADAHPGETVVVVLDADTLDPGTVVELAIDADDWVCVAWG